MSWLVTGWWFVRLHNKTSSTLTLQQIITNSLLKEDKNYNFIPAFVLSCSFPKEPAGGEVSVTHLHPGGEAYFRCLTGYRLQGMKMLTCRNATTPYWSGKEPRCVGKFFFKIVFTISSQCCYSDTTMVLYKQVLYCLLFVHTDFSNVGLCW